ncbi:hypothetical protein FN846DRAFT_888554 [Sphaerosporella brunnea]|uniref:Uncharacterized protein n=1 Tax=Sphaerosporella brunnea TaxID=1250544 RepID=A0A5J5F2K9_9PEZI|nr:hypothetical protein FN846DRAFT_888554 [Sphaerosporella brunnea]
MQAPTGPARPSNYLALFKEHKNPKKTSNCAPNDLQSLYPTTTADSISAARVSKSLNMRSTLSICEPGPYTRDSRAPHFRKWDPNGDRGLETYTEQNYMPTALHVPMMLQNSPVPMSRYELNGIKLSTDNV